MKRVWLGVLLMAWTSVVSLLAYAPAAYAAGETYSFTDATHIHASGGDFGGGIDFVLNGGVFVGVRVVFSGRTSVTMRWEISNLGGSPGTDYSATIKPTANATTPTGPITIKDTGSKGPTGLPAASPPPPAAGTAEQSNCNALDFSWIVCGALKIGLIVVNSIRDYIIVPFLEEQPLDAKFTAPDGSQPNLPTYKIWSAMRNIASVLLIFVFFLTIFGTAIGFDNYTVKKVLPRLIAGAIFVPFSWYICVVLIDIGNVLGQGLLTFTSSVIPPSTLDFRSDISKIFLGGTVLLVGTAAIAGIATISLGLILTILIALFGVFLTLVFRKIMIVILIILSPLAFLAWILPNTEKWFRQWWQNLFKLIMMYPLIMLLFESGRLFAYAAGSLTGSANSSVKGLFQVTGLFAPTLLIPWTFKWAGGALALGSNQIGKFTSNLDKRFGKDSDMAKDRAAERERMNLIREDNASKAAKTAMENGQLGRAARLNLAAAGFRARSGMGSGPGGLRKGGLQPQARRTEALAKARTATANFGANKKTNEIPNAENADQRIAAEERQILDKLAADRGVRHGVLKAVDDLGGDSRALTAAAYNAALINSARDYSTQHGKNQGVQDAEGTHKQKGDEIAAHAREIEADSGTKLRGQVSGTIRTALETDYAQVLAGNAANMDQARLQRLQATSHAASKAAKDNFTDDHGKNAGVNETERAIIERDLAEATRIKGSALTPEERQVAMAATSRHRTATALAAAKLAARGATADAEQLKNERVNQEELANGQYSESTESVLENARLQARTKLASEKQERLERLNANNPAAGGEHIDDRMVLDAAGETARSRATTEVGDIKGALRAGEKARLEGETIASQIEAATEVGELKRSNESGDRRGVLKSRNADMEKVTGELTQRYQDEAVAAEAARKNRPLGRAEEALARSRSAAASAVRARANAGTQRISERIAIAAEHAEEKYSEESGGRRPSLDAVATAEATAKAEGRDYHQDLLKAGGAKAKDAANAKIGQRQGVLDSAGKQNDNLVDQNAARYPADAAAAKAAADRRGIVKGTVDARQRAIDNAAKKFKTLSPDQAADSIRDSISEASEFTSRKKAGDEVAQAQGTVRGARAVENKARRDQLEVARGQAVAQAEAAAIAGGRTFTEADRKRVKAGVKPLTNDQARRAALTTGAAAAAIDTSRKLVESYGQERATLNDESANFLKDEDRIGASEYKAGKRFAAESADLRGALQASEAEARRDKLEVGSQDAALASVRRASLSATTDARKRYGKAFGAEQATINVDRGQGHITADEAAEETENASNVSYGEEAAKTKGNITGQRKAQEKALRAAVEADAKTKGKSADEKRDIINGMSAEQKRDVAQRQIIRTAAAGAAYRGQTETARAYEQARGAAAGVKRAITNIQNDARKAGETLSDTQAEERMYDTLGAEYMREGYNKVVGEVSKAQGVKEAREQQRVAAMVDIAKRRGIKDITKTTKEAYADIASTAEELIEVAGHNSGVSKTRDSIVKGTGAEIGQLRGEEGGIADETNRLISEAGVDINANAAAIRRANPSISMAQARIRAQAQFRNQILPQFRNQARQNIATNKVRDSANDADFSAGNQIGQERIGAEARDIAEDREQDTTTGADTEAATDVVLENGDIVKAGGTIKAGNRIKTADPTKTEQTFDRDVTLDDGTVIAANQPVPEGSKIRPGSLIPDAKKINRQQAQERTSRRAIVAGAEQAKRSKSKVYGNLEALSEAAASDTNPSLEARMEIARKSERNTLAAEEGTAKATLDSRERNWKDTVSLAEAGATDRLFDGHVADAGSLPDREYDNLRPSEIELNDDGIAYIKERFRQAKRNNDPETMTAMLKRLSVTEGGQEAASQLRTGKKVIVVKRADDSEYRMSVAENVKNYDDVTGDLEYETYKKPSDPPGTEREVSKVPVNLGGTYGEQTSPEFKIVWDRGMKGATGLDSNKPTLAAASDFSAEKLRGRSAHEVNRYMDMIQEVLTAPAGKYSAETVKKVREDAEQFNSAFQAAVENRNTRGSILPDTAKAIYDQAKSGNTFIDPKTAQAAATILPAPGKVTYFPAGKSTQAILKAVEQIRGTKDVPLTAAIVERARSTYDPVTKTSPILKTIKERTLEGTAQSITAADLGIDPESVPPTRMSQPLQEFLLSRVGAGKGKDPIPSLDDLADIAREYERNDDYKASVDQAFLADQTPLPPI